MCILRIPCHLFKGNSPRIFELATCGTFFSVRIPVASQVTALEIWLLACILLVFGALAEYAFILR